MISEPNGSHAPAGSGILGVAAILVGVAGTFLWASLLAGPLQLVTGLLDARDHLQAAEDELSKGRTNAARFDTLSAAAAADKARRGLQTGSPAYDLAARLPVIGDALKEVNHLVAAAEHSSNAALGTLQIAESALKGPDRLIVPDPDDPKGGSQIRIERVHELADLIGDVQSEVVRSRTELESVRLGNLPQRIRGPVTKGIRTARDAESTLADARAGFEILPAILGADGPRHYLVGFQNTAEQRGTGGAILRFQEVRITDGKLDLSGKTNTVYDVDLNRTPLDIDLPADAWYVAGIEDAQRFGNANWSPDWPLSAQLTLAYGQATSSDVPFPTFDGVIGIDPVAIQELLPGTGPFKTPGSGNRISSRKVVHLLLYKAYASFPIPGVRRVVLNQVVDGFVERLLDPQKPTELVDGMGTALARKHMQMWMRDPAEQTFIKAMDWDGGIDLARGDDYIYVVEQNVGGNKLDFFDSNTTSMTIQIDGNEARHRTELIAHNGVFLPQPRYSMGDTQSGRACSTTRCPTHRPMLNLYVQNSATLLGADVRGVRLDTPSPAVWIDGGPPTHDESNKKVWSGTLQIPPGEDAALVFDYLVPNVVRTEDGRSVYRLHVQHQPKVRAEQLVIELRLPSGAREVRARGWKRSGDVLVWENALRNDLVLEVSWQP